MGTGYPTNPGDPSSMADAFKIRPQQRPILSLWVKRSHPGCCCWLPLTTRAVRSIFWRWLVSQGRPHTGLDCKTPQPCGYRRERWVRGVCPQLELGNLFAVGWWGRETFRQGWQGWQGCQGCDGRVVCRAGTRIRVIHGSRLRVHIARQRSDNPRWPAGRRGSRSWRSRHRAQLDNCERCCGIRSGMQGKEGLSIHIDKVYCCLSLFTQCSVPTEPSRNCWQSGGALWDSKGRDMPIFLSQEQRLKYHTPGWDQKRREKCVSGSVGLNIQKQPANQRAGK